MKNMLQDKIAEVWQVEICNKNSLAVPEQKPRGFVLGGQPGAGKSNLIRKIRLELARNVLIINADDYRKYHPKYREFQAQDSKESASKTQEFAALMAEAILQKAIDEKYNIVIEGTFRTAQTPIKTLQRFKDNGYITEAMIQTCHKDISWNACLERYQKMLAINPQEARYTPKEHHDLVVSCLAKNIQIVLESQTADFLSVYLRIPTNEQDSFENQKIYDSRHDKNFPAEMLHNAIHNEEKNITTRKNKNKL